MTAEDLEPSAKMFRDMFNRSVEEGLAPKEVAEMVLKAIVDETFYVLPHARWKNMIHARMENIIEERDPTIVRPPEM